MAEEEDLVGSRNLWGPLGALLRLSREVSWGSWGSLWGPVGVSWGLLGASWGLLGASWGLSGASRVPLWDLLGPLGVSWAPLGGSWGVLGPILESFWTSFWNHFGVIFALVVGPRSRTRFRRHLRSFRIGFGAKLGFKNHKKR